MRTKIMHRLRMLGRVLHRSGPYLLLEIVLPGGTLFALLLFVYQHRQLHVRSEYAPQADVAVTRTLGKAREEAPLARAAVPYPGS